MKKGHLFEKLSLLMPLFFLFFCCWFIQGWSQSSGSSQYSSESSQESSFQSFNCSPVPPSSFCGNILKHKFASQEEIAHVLRWTKSPDRHVVGYKIFQGQKLLKKTSKNRVVIHNRHRDVSYQYKLVAVDSRGRESSPLFLVVGKKNPTAACTDCPEFTVINPFVTLGIAEIFFHQTFTTSSCIRDAVFTTRSVLPEGLTLSEDGTLSGIPTEAGTFPIIVTVTDANGCAVRSPVYLLTIECSIITIAAEIVNPTCHDLSNGRITIIASGGIPPLLYSIDGGAFQESDTFEDLAAGTYSFTVKDDNDCVSVGSATLINPEEIAFTTTLENPLCNGASDGSIAFDASGGTPPYVYSINGGEDFEPSNVFTGLSAGAYHLLVQDEKGCLASGLATLTNPPALFFTTQTVNPSCDGGSNGSITFAASGGTPPLLYSIDGGETFQESNVFLNLAADTYALQVRDANQCVSTGSATLTNPPAIIFTTDDVNPTCSFGVNGSITISASGGTPPLAYSINGGNTFQSSNVFTGLGAGIYSILVKDVNDCIASGTSTLTEPPPFTFDFFDIKNVTCFGGADGEISIIGLSGGTPPYSFSLNGGAFQPSNTFTGLPAGIYELTTKDANGCLTSFGELEITQPAPISFTTQIANPCTEVSTGSITILATGGTPPFSYSINGGVTFQPSNVFTGLAEGTYPIVVKDANNCQATGTATLAIPTLLSISVSKVDVNCNGESTGSITIDATGGTPSYSYSINGGVTFQASNVFTGLGDGDYLIVVKDANGCLITEPAAINQPDAISYNVTLTCIGFGTLGIIEFIDLDGGTPPYQYSIDNGQNFEDISAFAVNPNGTYFPVVRDSKGCLAFHEPIEKNCSATVQQIDSVVVDPIEHSDN